VRRGAARSAFLAVAVAGAAAAADGAAAAGTNAPPAATGAPEVVRKALDRLAEHGVRPDAVRLEDELLAAVVAGVDPGGDLLTEARFQELELERQGRVRGIGVRLVRSTRRWPGSADPPAMWPCPSCAPAGRSRLTWPSRRPQRHGASPCTLLPCSSAGDRPMSTRCHSSRLP